MVLRMDRTDSNDCVHCETQEHQPVSTEEGGSHTRSDSIINSDGFGSVRRHNRPTGTGNDRLPGSVLLARERLVERLRGVTASGNR